MNGSEIMNEDSTTRIEGCNGCIGCGNRERVASEVDMSKMAEVEIARKAKMEAEYKRRIEVSCDYNTKKNI